MNKITLATLAQATEQEVFDQVASHLLTQKKRSLAIEISDGCVYRGEGGMSCAAGCLISDEEYDEVFEFKSWTGLVREKMVPDVHSKLITTLQDVHDGCEVKNWREKLDLVADIFKLKKDVLNK